MTVIDFNGKTAKQKTVEDRNEKVKKQMENCPYCGEEGMLPKGLIWEGGDIKALPPSGGTAPCRNCNPKHSQYKGDQPDGK